MSLPSQTFNYKIRLIAVSIGFLIIIIIGRLAYLQIFLNNRLLQLSEKNFLRFEHILSPRGNIFDCHGNILATNRPVTSIVWNGSGSKQLLPSHHQLLETIHQIIDKPFHHTATLSAIAHAEKTAKKIVLISDISFDQLSKIIELYPNHPTIEIATHFKRFYPHQTLASHILGYITQINVETMGKMGLEKMLEEVLQGIPGQNLNIINSLGTNLHTQEIKKALAGENITTTLDLSLQKLVELNFPENQKGTFIILDPKTGALKALLSRPNFDPSTFLNPITQNEWQLLQEHRPFLNRSLNACYPPASIFKLVTISAAMEHHLLAPDTIIHCRGSMRFKGRPYHCARQEGHGPVSIEDSLAQSCNILFFELAKKISIDMLADYAHRFGLGEKTNIIFPENEGLIPTSRWKLEKKRERWWPGDTISAVIGQSYLLVTPMQIACMIGSIFEGYRVKPRILENEPIIKIPVPIQTSTRDFLKHAMRMVTLHGTAINVSKLRDITVYSKTGTAQTSSLDKREQGIQYMEHAWYVSYFNYKDKNPLVLVILVENVGSSKTATSIAKKFFINYRDLLENVHTEKIT